VYSLLLTVLAEYEPPRESDDASTVRAVLLDAKDQLHVPKKCNCSS